MRRGWGRVLAGACLATLAAFSQDTTPKVDNDPNKHEEIKSLRQYYGPVMSAKFFKKGSAFISGGKDKVLRVWNSVDGKMIRELRGHKNWVLALAVSPDEKRVASVGTDGLVILWDLDKGESLKTYRLSSHPFNFPLSVAFHPIENRMAVGMRDGTVTEIDNDTGKSVFKVKAGDAIVKSVAYSPDGKQIAASAWEVASIWDRETGEKVATLSKHTNAEVTAIAYDPTGKFMATGGTDSYVRWWEVKTGRLLGRFKGHDLPVLCLAIDPTGTYVASGASDAVIHLWNVKSKQSELKLEGHHISVNSVDFAADGRALVSTSLDSTIRVWSLPDGKPLQSIQGHGGFLYTLAYSPDGQYLAAGGVEYSVKMWNTSEFRLEKTLTKGWDDTVYRIAFDPRGSSKITVGYKNGKIKMWDYTEERVDREFLAHRQKVWAVAHLAGGRYMATGGEDSFVIVWDLHNNRPVKTLGHDSTVLSIAVHPTQPILASSDEAGLVQVWKVDEKKQNWSLFQIYAHEKAANCVRFSPDGTMLASASSDGTIRLWDAKTGKFKKQFTGHEGSVRMIEFHPKDHYLASCGEDGTVRIWDVDLGACTEVLGGFLDEVSCLTYSPDGRFLATGAWDGEIKIWMRSRKSRD